MKSSRRRFLKSAGVVCAAAPLSAVSANVLAAGEPRKVTKAQLDRVLDTPVLDTTFLKRPVTVASIELLRVVKAGSTLGYVECEVKDQTGKLVAKAASTCMKLRQQQKEA